MVECKVLTVQEVVVVGKGNRVVTASDKRLIESLSSLQRRSIRYTKCHLISPS